MVPVRMVGDHIVRGASLQGAAVLGRPVDDWIVGHRQDARDVTGILNIGDRSARKDTYVGIQLIVGLGGIRQIVTVTDRRIANVARHQHALGRIQDVPSSHRIPDRVVFHESSAWNLARHVEVHRVVTELSTLPHLVELNSLDLNLLESLADYHVAAEPVALGGRGYRWRWRRRKGGRYRVSIGIDTNAAGQQRHCRASVNRRPASRRLSTSDLAQTVNRRVMWKLQRRREG